MEFVRQDSVLRLRAVRYGDMSEAAVPPLDTERFCCDEAREEQMHDERPRPAVTTLPEFTAAMREEGAIFGQLDSSPNWPFLSAHGPSCLWPAASGCDQPVFSRLLRVFGVCLWRHAPPARSDQAAAIDLRP